MKKYIFLLILPVLAFTAVHKFYLSVTNISYSEKDDAFQVTTRIFIDDLEAVLKERYGIEGHLATKDEANIADTYIEKYLRTKLLLYLDEKPIEYTFLGKKYEDDVVICYLELPDVGLEKLKNMAIENEILTDLYDEQKNVVHVKWKDNKKSFVLLKSNAKGMLNL